MDSEDRSPVWGSPHLCTHKVSSCVLAEGEPKGELLGVSSDPAD